MQLIRVKTAADLKKLARRLETPPEFRPRQDAAVAKILEAVRRGGDKALIGFARRFDHSNLTPSDLRVSPREVKAAYAKVDRAFLAVLSRAKASIAAFQERLLRGSWRRHVRPGVLLGQLVKPIQRVGLCVPSGDAPLVSTVLMTAVPARVAGVPELVMVSPARNGKDLDPRLLVAADVSGVTEIYRVGGAHAVAALAFGTRVIARVDKIVGPGSSWVAAAQRMVFGQVGVDMVAGPSEILILAEEGADPAYLAADLLSQAEHAGEESAVLVTPSAKLALAVRAEVERQALKLGRQRAIGSSLSRFGLIAVVKDMDMALDLANAKAPEHLELMVREPERYLPRIQNAGAIFLGAYTPEAVGDYVAGPSHVLPTGGSARYASGLSVESFLKKSSIIGYTRPALEAARGDIQALALSEGLEAHAASVTARRK